MTLCDQVIGTFHGCMIDFYFQPINLTTEINDETYEIEYGVGLDNPGFYFKLNGTLWHEIPSGPESESPQEFERGMCQNDISNGLQVTDFEVYVGPTMRLVHVRVTYSKKLYLLKLAVDKCQEI